MSNDTHAIQRQIIELKVSDKAQFEEVKEEVKRDLQQLFADTLEEVSDRMVPPSQKIVLDRVEIDLGILKEDVQPVRIKETIAEHLSQAIKKQLRPNTQETTSPKDQQHGPAETLVYFLKTGTMPWWATKSAKETIVEAFRKSANQTSVVRFLLQSEESLLRLVRNIPDAELVDTWFPQWTDTHKEAIKWFFSQVRKKRAPSQIRLQLWKILLSLRSKTEAAPDLLSLFAESLQNREILPLQDLFESELPADQAMIRQWKEIAGIPASDPATKAGTRVKQQTPAQKDEQVTPTNPDATVWIEQLHKLLESPDDQLKFIRSIEQHLKKGKNLFSHSAITKQLEDLGALVAGRKNQIRQMTSGLTSAEVKALNSRVIEVQTLLDRMSLAPSDPLIKDWKALLKSIKTRIHPFVIGETKQPTDVPNIPLPDLSAEIRSLQGLTTPDPFTPEWAQAIKKLADWLVSHQKTDTQATVAEVVKELKWLVRDIQRISDTKEFEPKAPEVKQKIPFESPDTIYLDNAGLVILWIFIKRLFENLSWLNEKEEFADEEKQERAVMLLYYLCTGHTEAVEPDLPLCKLLCGIQVEQGVEVSFQPEPVEEEAVTTLLETAIKSNPMLKEQSPGGFRGNFLMRSGILQHNGDSWQLHVESKSHDIITRQFPWQWKVVRFPWMEQPLLVEWD